MENKENGPITTEKSATSKSGNRQKGGNALKVIQTNANIERGTAAHESYIESAAIDAMATELNTDVFEKENEEDGESAKFKGRELINKETWKTLSDNLNSMIKECGYPNAPESRLSIETLDVVVGGKIDFRFANTVIKGEKT